MITPSKIQGRVPKDLAPMCKEVLEHFTQADIVREGIVSCFWTVKEMEIEA